MAETGERRIGAAEASGALRAARERRVELQAAAVRVEEALAAPSGLGDGWAIGVFGALGSLDEAFTGHLLATEGPEALFDEILEEAPRLSHKVDDLRAEHDTLRAMIAGCREIAGLAGAAGELGVEEVRRDASALLLKLAVHRQKGADVVYEAYSVDLGQGG